MRHQIAGVQWTNHLIFFKRSRVVRSYAHLDVQVQVSAYISVPVANNLQTLKVFGNRQRFAIQYRPNDESEFIHADDKLAFCHLIVANKLLGDENEVCYLPTWVYYLTDRKNFIEQNRHALFPKKFESLSNREIFETIMKSSQSEEEYFPEFIYLPRMDGQISYRHQFTLDETIDGYYFFYYIKDNQITFLIEDCKGMGWQTIRSYKLLFFAMDLSEFLNTITEAVTFLTTTYPYLEKHVSKRMFSGS